MLRRNAGATGLLALAVFLTALALGQNQVSALNAGEALPMIAGLTVAGKPLSLPVAANGSPTG